MSRPNINSDDNAAIPADIEAQVPADQYSQYITPVLAEIDEYDGNLWKMKSYLGSGTHKDVFRADTPDGPVAIKIFKKEWATNWLQITRSTSTPEKLIEEQTLLGAAILTRGAGVPGLEKLIAADPQRGVLITTLAPGKLVSKMSPVELIGINKSHLTGLQETLAAMRERGLHPHNSGSLFFDRKTGFTFADFELEENMTDGSVVKTFDLETFEKFVESALEDHAKFDGLTMSKAMGMNVKHDMYQTTGLRALARNVVAKRASKIQGHK